MFTSPISSPSTVPLISDASSIHRPFQPFGGILKMMLCRDDEVIMDGPVGTGKSRGMLEKGHLCLMKYPGARGLLVRKTRESLTQSVMVTYEQHVLPFNENRVKWRTTEQEYRYWNGSRLVVGGLDKPSKIMSTEFDFILVFELTEIMESDWEMLTTRARNGVMPYNQVMGDCNPGPANSWVKKRWEDGKATRCRTTHQDNPTLWNHEKGEWTDKGRNYIAKLERLTGIRRKRLYLGEWVSAEGVIYEEFIPDVHVIDRFKIPDNWKRFCSVDFGFVHPFVCQWWAISPEDVMYLYREIHFSRRIVRAHTQQIQYVSRNEFIEMFVCDWDAEDRATMEEAGLLTMAAEKSVSVGIQTVKERLKPTESSFPKMLFMRDSLVEEDRRRADDYLPTKTIDEFDLYVWANKKLKELPVKENDDGMDAMRYAAMYAANNRANGGIWI